MTSNNYNTSFTFPKNPKALNPSYKTDLDFWNCFWKEKKLRLITEEIGHAKGNGKGYRRREVQVLDLFPCLLQDNIVLGSGRKKSNVDVQP